MIFSSTRVTAYIVCLKHSFFLFLTALEVSLVTQLFRLSKVREKQFFMMIIWTLQHSATREQGVYFYISLS